MGGVLEGVVTRISVKEAVEIARTQRASPSSWSISADKVIRRAQAMSPGAARPITGTGRRNCRPGVSSDPWPADHVPPSGGFGRRKPDFARYELGHVIGVRGRGTNEGNYHLLGQADDAVSYCTKVCYGRCLHSDRQSTRLDVMATEFEPVCRGGSALPLRERITRRLFDTLGRQNDVRAADVHAGIGLRGFGGGDCLQPRWTPFCAAMRAAGLAQPVMVRRRPRIREPIRPSSAQDWMHRLGSILGRSTSRSLSSLSC